MPETTGEAVTFEAHQFIAFSSRSRDYGELRFIANGGNAVHVRMDYSLLENLVAELADMVPARNHKKPRITCPVCSRDVVKRDDGKPMVHYALNNDPAFTCDGNMFSRCRGGCKCRRHRA